MTDPENAGRDQAGRFAKGRSGNVTGKPKGMTTYTAAEWLAHPEMSVTASHEYIAAVRRRLLQLEHQLGWANPTP